jgi:hypothetical protein
MWCGHVISALTVTVPSRRGAPFDFSFARMTISLTERPPSAFAETRALPADAVEIGPGQSPAPPNDFSSFLPPQPDTASRIRAPQKTGRMHPG